MDVWLSFLKPFVTHRTWVPARPSYLASICLSSKVWYGGLVVDPNFLWTYRKSLWTHCKTLRPSLLAGGSLLKKTKKEVPIKVWVPGDQPGDLVVLKGLWDDSCFSFIWNFNLTSHIYFLTHLKEDEAPEMVFQGSTHQPGTTLSNRPRAGKMA